MCYIKSNEYVLAVQVFMIHDYIFDMESISVCLSEQCDVNQQLNGVITMFHSATQDDSLAISRGYHAFHF